MSAAVPWTRILQHGPTTAPTASDRRSRPAGCARTAARLVLKRSWDYGGKGVFLGNELAAGAVVEARLRTLLGRAPAEPVGWDALVDFALADYDAWVVQELVPALTERICASTDGASRRAISTSICRRSPTSATRRARRAARCGPPRAASSTSSAAAACRR